jgi:hypothetical protein
VAIAIVAIAIVVVAIVAIVAIFSNPLGTGVSQQPSARGAEPLSNLPIATMTLPSPTVPVNSTVPATVTPAMLPAPTIEDCLDLVLLPGAEQGEYEPKCPEQGGTIRITAEEIGNLNLHGKPRFNAEADYECMWKLHAGGTKVGDYPSADGSCTFDFDPPQGVSSFTLILEISNAEISPKIWRIELENGTR